MTIIIIIIIVIIGFSMKVCLLTDLKNLHTVYGKCLHWTETIATKIGKLLFLNFRKNNTKDWRQLIPEIRNQIHILKITCRYQETEIKLKNQILEIRDQNKKSKLRNLISEHPPRLSILVFWFPKSDFWPLISVFWSQNLILALTPCEPSCSYILKNWNTNFKI